MKSGLILSMKQAILAILCMGIVFTSTAQIDYTVGNGTTDNGQYGLPTPFEDYYDGDRQQFLFRVSELNAAGMYGPGVITAIKWDVLNKYSQGAIPGYEITIGGTTLSDLGSGWATGITTPIISTGASGSYTVNVGINAFQLATPYIWNGTDNIVVQVCHGSASRTCYTYTNCAAVRYTTTSFVSTRYLRQDCSGSLCATATGYALTSPQARPNTIFTFGLPCDDTPKTSILGPKVICPAKSFTLRPDSFYSNAEFKWEFSYNGTAWSKFTGVPNLFGEIRDSITVAKSYRLTVTCDSNKNFTWTTPVHKVDIAPFYYCYCDNNVTSDAGTDIGNLTIINTNKFDTVYNKSKLFTGTGNPVYSNALSNRKYTAYHDSLAWPCLYRDTTYLYNITQIHSTATFTPSMVQAYIDYDRDGLYDPNTERIFISKLDGTTSPQHVLQITAKVPSIAEIGPTGLRVIISQDTVKGAPCDTISGGGEVEDYIVNICYRPCDAPVKAGIVMSTDTSMCAGYEYTLTDTTYEKERSGFSRAWQVSGDDVTWFNVTNSQEKDTLERKFTGQPLFYRLRTICLPTSDTAYSAATKINVKPGYKCYCYSKAIGGKNIDTSDIGGVSIATFVSNAGGPHLLNPAAVRPRTDFTDDDPIEIFTDSAYSFSVYHTMPVVEHGDSKVTIFMDFNNNHSYEIPDERIYTGYTTIGNHTLIDNVVVPVTAITDVPTGMRVILNNDVGPNIPSDEACGPYTSGETEDYILVFRKKWNVGISEANKLTGFNVHPNPTTGKFFVQFSTQADIKEVKVRVTNVTGQVMEEQVYNHDGGMFYKELNMTGKASGVYFVELQADGQKLMRKLVIQ